ncbi:hypothetical protein ANANG_G00157870, partial [Anguilla anguilla]
GRYNSSSAPAELRPIVTFALSSNSLSSATAIVVIGLVIRNVIPQDFPNQALLGEKAEAKQTNSAVDPHENRQQDQVQLQEETLEED